MSSIDEPLELSRKESSEYIADIDLTKKKMARRALQKMYNEKEQINIPSTGQNRSPSQNALINLCTGGNKNYQYAWLCKDVLKHVLSAFKKEIRDKLYQKIGRYEQFQEKWDCKRRDEENVKLQQAENKFNQVSENLDEYINTLTKGGVLQIPQQFIRPLKEEKQKFEANILSESLQECIQVFSKVIRNTSGFSLIANLSAFFAYCQLVKIKKDPRMTKTLYLSGLVGLIIALIMILISLHSILTQKDKRIVNASHLFLNHFMCLGVLYHFILSSWILNTFSEDKDATTRVFAGVSLGIQLVGLLVILLYLPYTQGSKLYKADIFAKQQQPQPSTPQEIFDSLTFTQKFLGAFQYGLPNIPNNLFNFLYAQKPLYSSDAA